MSCTGVRAANTGEERADGRVTGSATSALHSCYTGCSSVRTLQNFFPMMDTELKKPD